MGFPENVCGRATSPPPHPNYFLSLYRSMLYESSVCNAFRFVLSKQFISHQNEKYSFLRTPTSAKAIWFLTNGIKTFTKMERSILPWRKFHIFEKMKKSIEIR